MKDNLQIITRIKKTVVYLDNIVVNFPTKELELRTRIKDDIYMLLELAYQANEEPINDRRLAYQNMLKVKIKMIDFYIKMAYDKEIISKKKMLIIGKHLYEIILSVNAWVKSDTNRNEERM